MNTSSQSYTRTYKFILSIIMFVYLSLCAEFPPPFQHFLSEDAIRHTRSDFYVICSAFTMIMFGCLLLTLFCIAKLCNLPGGKGAVYVSLANITIAATVLNWLPPNHAQAMSMFIQSICFCLGSGLGHFFIMYYTYAYRSGAF